MVDGKQSVVGPSLRRFGKTFRGMSVGWVGDRGMRVTEAMTGTFVAAVTACVCWGGGGQVSV